MRRRRFLPATVSRRPASSSPTHYLPEQEAPQAQPPSQRVSTSQLPAALLLSQDRMRRRRLLPATVSREPGGAAGASSLPKSLPISPGQPNPCQILTNFPGPSKSLPKSLPISPVPGKSLPKSLPFLRPTKNRRGTDIDFQFSQNTKLFHRTNGYG